MVQIALDTFAGIAERMGLHLNPTKTKAMASLFQADTAMSADAYNRRYDSSLPTYRERQRQKVECPVCHAAMARQFLPRHMDEQHPGRKRNLDRESDRPSKRLRPSLATARTYQVSMPTWYTPVPCPVPGCPATPVTRERMRDHFCTMHVQDVIHISEEEILPRCPHCGKFTHSVGQAHVASKTCQARTARLQRRSKLNAPTVVFTVGNKPIENVEEFKYLGRFVKHNDDDIIAVNNNLKKARATWGRYYRLLRSDGADKRTMARFYLAVANAQLLFGSETWTLDKRTLQWLESFHRQCARYITGQHIRQLPDGSWHHPDMTAVLDSCNLSPISIYIAKRKETLLHYARQSSSLYRECLDVGVHPPYHHILWWA